MSHREFRQLVIDAGFTKPDYTKTARFLGVTPQWVRALCTKYDCAAPEHIQKLEALARERKDANS